MYAFIYILLTPIRYTVSFIGFVVTALLLGINWCLTGEYDHEPGLIGLLCCQIPAWVLDRINLPLVRLHQSYKPAAWTFNESVTAYRKCIRWWADKAAHDYEYEKATQTNIEKAKNGKERKFWIIIQRQAEKRTKQLTDEIEKELTKN